MPPPSSGVSKGGVPCWNCGSATRAWISQYALLSGPHARSPPSSHGLATPSAQTVTSLSAGAGPPRITLRSAGTASVAVWVVNTAALRTSPTAGVSAWANQSRSS